MFVCSRHNAHLPYSQLTAAVNWLFFFSYAFISFLHPKVQLRSTLDDSCKVKGTQAAGILPSDKPGFLNTADSPSEDLFLVCFILKFLPPRCTLSFSSFLIITMLWGGSGGSGHSPGLRNNPLPCWPFPPRHFSQPPCWGKSKQTRHTEKNSRKWPQKQ